MGIWKILQTNLEHGNRARRPEEGVPLPEDFRGRLLHAAFLCTGCRTCAYVCSPGAIHFSAEPGLTWRYFAGQCSFCGRCVDFCPTQALSFGTGAAAVTEDRAALLQQHPVESQPCTRCGQPITPLPETLLARLYGGQKRGEVEQLNHLCPRCRSQCTVQRLHQARCGSADSQEVQA